MGLEKRHVIERQGKTYVLFGGLLALAHEQSEGRLHIATDLIQIPGPENGHVAICRCEARIADENGAVIRSCTGIGDASQENVGRMVANATIRMAEVRAKARALRDLTNSAEAVDDLEDDPREPDGGAVATTHGQRAEAPKPRMAEREFSRQPEARGLEPAAKPTPQEWFAGMAKLAGTNGVPVPAVPDGAGDEWYIREGKRLQAETKAVLSGAAR